MRPASFHQMGFDRSRSAPLVRLVSLWLILAVVWSGSHSASAREGDTLEPITINAPTLETWPENMLDEETDQRLINQRVNESRNGGVPLAVRIIDLTMPEDELPTQIRQYASADFDQPLTAEEQQEIAESWMRRERIETSPDANDGFLLLVLVPEDRTRTQAIWWIGPNALPLNGLTEQNILATHGVMDAHFAQGDMPGGVFMGVSEFSYNIQFGSPERLERSTLQDALHTAMIPIAIATSLAGGSVPVVAVWLSRRNDYTAVIDHELSPWEAAALHIGRVRPDVSAAMLLHAIHQGDIEHGTDGSIRISPGANGDAIEALRPYANDAGIVDAAAMYEIEAITEPVRSDIERRLSSIGAMTPDAVNDRNRILLVMGIAGFLAALSVVPSVASMSAPGILGIVISVLGVGSGWWWLAYRRYTSPAGEMLLEKWLESANEAERSAFDTVVYQQLLIDPAGGPDVPNQTQLIRRLRGLGSA